MTPVLLLIPGMTNTPRVWDRVRAHLQAEVQRGVEVRVTDVRASADIPAMAATAWRELQDVPLERPLAIAGFSMGGYVALQMVVSAPRPVQALALVCTSARPDNPAVAPMRERATAAAQRDWERYITRVIAGALDPLIAPAHSKEAADAIAGARWREVEGAGHLLPWERPQALAAAMDEWLAGL